MLVNMLFLVCLQYPDIKKTIGYLLHSARSHVSFHSQIVAKFVLTSVILTFFLPYLVLLYGRHFFNGNYSWKFQDGNDDKKYENMQRTEGQGRS